MLTNKESHEQCEPSHTSAMDSKVKEILQEINILIEEAIRRGETSVETSDYTCKTKDDFNVIDRVMRELTNKGYNIDKETWDTGSSLLVQIYIEW